MNRDIRKLDHLVDQMREDCPCVDRKTYCTLQMIIVNSCFTERFLTQVKCVEKFKYEESQRRGDNIGWDGAWDIWTLRDAPDSLAKKFSDVYEIHKDKPLSFIYAEVIKDL